MLIHEVCKTCALTKKAVKYYVEQGLVSPPISENGYRCFSEEDVARLKKIAVLRNLGLSVANIRAALSEGASALREAAGKTALSLAMQEEKQQIIEDLAAGCDWERAEDCLRRLEKKQSILERLVSAFPGYFGQYVCFHFAPYLNAPITTDAEQEAFQTVIGFLDHVDFDIPEQLRSDLDEMAAHLGPGIAETASVRLRDALENTEDYLAAHRGEIEAYLAWKQSPEYRASPAFALEESLRRFASASGYNEVFLPAMRRLSRPYREYCEALDRADQLFLQKYPQDQ